MRNFRLFNWLAVVISLAIIGFVSVIFLVIATDTEEKETPQSNQEIEDEIPNEEERAVAKKEEEMRLAEEKRAKEEEKEDLNPFPNDTFSHAGISDERFEKYLSLMENDNKEITKERVDWLIIGLDFVSKESRSGFEERINSLEDKVQ
ncbi:hypothetical protein [Gracilibacillus kekensis]|uniref:Uncharacterized protein n=1 Tax=Gracilibacillus kekensis TaxID=1027249 RepID=A0A1M7QXF2_9BACI|nr:hypothetical protein [Gracilibacillus kekensis]SHN36642.1 hypothetical protein SAMN05216179_3718 [Gracilibacillus kekensis]